MKRANWNKKKETSEFDLAFSKLMAGREWTKDAWEKRKAVYYFIQNSKDFIRAHVFAGRKDLHLSFEDIFIIISTFELSRCIDWNEEQGYHFIENGKQYEDFYMDQLANFTGHSEEHLIAAMKRYKQDNIFNSWDLRDTQETVMAITANMGSSK